MWLYFFTKVYILLVTKAYMPGVFDTPDILNLHFLNGIPIYMKECHAFIAEEDCISYAVAHLADR